jgi:hypothetical protein
VNVNKLLTIAVAAALCGTCRRSSSNGPTGGSPRTYTIIDSEGPRVLKFVDQDWKEAIVTDNVDVTLVRRTFRRFRPETDYCRERGKSTEGPIVATLIIGRAGEIEDVHFRTSQQTDPILLACIKESVKHWTFPSPNDDRMAVLRFVF